MKDEIQKVYGWHFLAKEVSDWTRLTFFEVLDKSCLEIFSTVLVMKNKIEVVKADRSIINK